MKYYDIGVIGGGASGLMAALTSARQKKSVVLLEGNGKLGKKLLATGNGRCNLSNRNVSPAHYHGDTEFLPQLLAKYTPKRIEEEFASLGLLLTTDSEGRMYPRNLQAAAVLRVLMDSCAEEGVDCLCDYAVFSAVKSGDCFVLKSADGRELRVKKLILATGGMASPKHSCGAEGYQIARQLGHSQTKLYPALTQFTTADKFIKPLSGMRCKADVTLIGDGKSLYSESGEVLFADKALSGICVFGLSVYGSEFFAKGSIGGKSYQHIALRLDLCPGMGEEDVKAFLTALAAKRPGLLAGDLLEGVVNMKVGLELVRSCGIDVLLPVTALKPRDFTCVVQKLKALVISINGVKGWQDAQVTAGGVPMAEVDPFTMESNKQPGLYLTGELLDLHGDCGGYNLHWAWLTGLAAGKAAASDTILL